MGGEGSTRWASWSKGRTVDECVYLDTKAFRPQRCFERSIANGSLDWSTGSSRPIISASYTIEGIETGTATGTATLRLRYIGESGGTSALIGEAITAVATRPNFGGQRWWFQCGGCGRRVRKLFLVTYRGGFRCRRCNRLTYRSCQESHTMDAFTRRLLRACGSLSGNGAEETDTRPKLSASGQNGRN